MTHSPAHVALLALTLMVVWIAVGVALAWWWERWRSRRVRSWLPPLPQWDDDSDPPP